jgi:hypothetical protein
MKHWRWALSVLASHVATAPGLEVDDDVGDLDVPLLLQVGQHSGPEEHLALPDPVQVRVQLQGFDLSRREKRYSLYAPRINT